MKSNTEILLRLKQNEEKRMNLEIEAEKIPAKGQGSFGSFYEKIEKQALLVNKIHLVNSEDQLLSQMMGLRKTGQNDTELRDLIETKKSEMRKEMKLIEEFDSKLTIKSNEGNDLSEEESEELTEKLINHFLLKGLYQTLLWLAPFVSKS